MRWTLKNGWNFEGWVIRVGSGKGMFSAVGTVCQGCRGQGAWGSGSVWTSSYTQLAAVQRWNRGVGLVGLPPRAQNFVLNSSRGPGEAYDFEGWEGHTRPIIRKETLQEANRSQTGISPLHPNALWLYKKVRKTLVTVFFWKYFQTI